MQESFGIVLFVVVAVAAVVAVWAIATGAGAYDEIGRDGIEPARADSAADEVAEIRQMLEAQSARRTARGEAPLDVEAELARRLAEL
jgi:hypothetical protein